MPTTRRTGRSRPTICARNSPSSARRCAPSTCPAWSRSGFEADDLIATYVRQACEAGATATIVASDKDLMQLVNDCVVMYDTMKDRKIGIPEVIEKFGVPPEKVIEVQALIGDSTDNVPGVPGIGVKTAAQLIGEYGDLETLLARAGEIKQEKRRQALIDNAELARLSKKLVTLDDHVELEVPLADLAVHEPDYKRLIAFLKAMEFSALTRRVAEFSGIDAAQIEAGRQAQGGRRRARLRQRRPELKPRRPATARRRSPGRTPAWAAGAGPAASASRCRAGASNELTPQALAAARIEAARNAKVDRSRYEIVRSLDRLNAWIARARELGQVAIDTETTSLDPMQAALCGFSLAVAANEACYVPLAHRQGGDGGNGGLFAGPIAPDQIEERAALAAMKPLLEDPGVLKIGQNLKYDLQIFALRGIELAPYDDTMLMSYVLDAGRSDHALEALVQALLRSRHDRFQRGHGIGKIAHHLRLRPDRQGRRIRRRGCRRGVAAVAGAQAADGRRAHGDGLRDAGAPPRAGARAHGAARHLDRSASAVAALRRVRPARRRARGRDPGACRRAAQSRQPEAARRHPVRQARTSRRHQDEDRPVVDRRARSRRAGRAGSPVAAENSRLAPGLEAQIDLYRRAAGLRRCPHPSRAHELRAGGDPDRPPLLLRAQPAEHSDPHRGRPQDQARLHRDDGSQARLRRLFADRVAAACGDRRHRAA